MRARAKETKPRRKGRAIVYDPRKCAGCGHSKTAHPDDGRCFDKLRNNVTCGCPKFSFGKTGDTFNLVISPSEAEIEQARSAARRGRNLKRITKLRAEGLERSPRQREYYWSRANNDQGIPRGIIWYDGQPLRWESWLTAKEAFGDSCAICLSKDPKHPQKRDADFSADHCHESRLFRGPLCAECNAGKFATRNPILAGRAMGYLWAFFLVRKLYQEGNRDELEMLHIMMQGPSGIIDTLRGVQDAGGHWMRIKNLDSVARA